jgi:hypothetical protein
LLLDSGKQFRVGLGIDLALEYLRRPGDREIGDLVAQRFLGAKHFLLDLGFRRGNDAVALGLGRALRLLDRLALEFFALCDDLGGTCLGLGHHLRDALLGFGQALAPSSPRPIRPQSASGDFRWHA